MIRRCGVPFALAVPLVAVAAVALSAHWPGAYTTDSYTQLSEALSREYSDWHPPLMAAWWGVLLRGSGSAGALLVFHHAMLVAALLWFAVLLWSHRARGAALVVTLLPLSPVVANFSAAMWKDVGAAFALALAAAAAAAPRGRSAGSEAARLAVVVLAGAYAVGVRLNAVGALPPLVLLAGWEHLRRRDLRGLLVPAAAAVAASLALAAGVHSLTRVVLRPRPLFTESYVQILDLAAVQRATGEDRFPASARAPGATRADVDAAYDTALKHGSGNFLVYGDRPPIKLPGDALAANDLATAWRAAIHDHPTVWIRNRLEFMGKLLRIGESAPYYWRETSGQRPDDASYLESWPTRAAIEKAYQRDASFRAPAAARARNLVDTVLERTPRSAFLGWPWLVAATAIVVLSPLLARRAGRPARVACLLAASGLLFALSYLPVTPAADFRYLYWTVLAVQLGSILMGSALVRAAFRPAREGEPSRVPGVTSARDSMRAPR